MARKMVKQKHQKHVKCSFRYIKHGLYQEPNTSSHTKETDFIDCADIHSFDNIFFLFPFGGINKFYFQKQIKV